jgi:hypothetical protein
VALPAVYGWRGSVPVPVVQSGVWVGWIIVVGVTSASTLLMYWVGGADAA